MHRVTFREQLTQEGPQVQEPPDKVYPAGQPVQVVWVEQVEHEGSQNPHSVPLRKNPSPQEVQPVVVPSKMQDRQPGKISSHNIQLP